MYIVQFDDNPKSYFLLPQTKQTTEGRNETTYSTLEADRETDLILKEKIHLYTHSQTITIKGDESWWGDFCIQQGIINAGTLGQKGVLMEVKHPPTLVHQDGVLLQLWKFLQHVRSDAGQNVRSVVNMPRYLFETNNDVNRATFYLKLLSQQECFLKPENE